MTRSLIEILLISVLVTSSLAAGWTLPIPLNQEPVSANSAPQTAPSFNVTWATTENATLGDTVVIVAEITNWHSASVNSTQQVELRYYGELIEARQVYLAANGSKLINFTVEISPELQYIKEDIWIHFTVQTPKHGFPVWLYVENSTVENTTTIDESH